MHWPLHFVLVLLYIGGGVTKTPGSPGISQFWTDDYKVFDQIYGKTSDKEIFGATLPPSVSYGGDSNKFKISDAIDKKERYPDNDGQNTEVEDQVNLYGYGNRYNNLLAKQYSKQQATKKPAKVLNFIGASDFKPISQNNDPDTYNYLKHLERLQKQKKENSGKAAGYKPYVTYTTSTSEEGDAYKSIQDILDAHEANKGANGNEDTDDQVKYLTYPPKGGNRAKTQKARAPPVKAKIRCPSGRCRKRATAYRVYTRPYVRKIKHKIYYS